MDKLLQLLNDYSPLKDTSDEYCVKYWKVWIRTRLYAEPDVYVNYTLQIISKKFWFIEWLVLNMKINTDELMRHWHIVKTYDLDEPWDSYGYVDSLLMLLTIQDEPIDFLNSILK